MRVIFRKYKDNGDIVAIFPDDIDQRRGMVGCYEHIGQHGDCNYHVMLQITKLATPEEYKELLQELVRIGYRDLRVVQRNIFTNDI